MNKKLLFRLFALVAAMMCALGMQAAEAYACYTPSNTTLTFYYDSQRSLRPGTTYDMNTGYNYPDWYSDGTNLNVTKVVFDPSFAGARPTSTIYWFFALFNLQSITGLEYLNTSEVTDMAWMFFYCSNLTSLDFSHFNTSKVNSMYNMLGYCQSLTSLDLSGFNTANVTNMSYMFYGCTGLTSLDLSGFNTAKVTKTNDMFNGCSNLRTIYVGNGWSTAAVTSSGNMFGNCTSLVGGQGTTWNSSNPRDKTYAHLDGGPDNPGYFTDINPSAYACYTESNTTLTFYYDNLRSSRPGTTYDLNTGNTTPGWHSDGNYASVTQVVFDPSFADVRPTSTRDWFYDMGNLQSITGMSYLNTNEVTNMDYLFDGCSRLSSLDLSSFNTSNVTSMSYMFFNCYALTSLDLSSFNTSQVTDMNRMFFDCRNLRTIYVGDIWSTAAVTYSDNMFYGCYSLVGGLGTTWNSSNPRDKTYAHLDSGPDNPGYFTAGTEAYACYTSDNTTLMFYYDNLRSSRPGTTYDLNEGANITGWGSDGTNASVTKVVFDPSFVGARPTTTSGWFYAMTILQSITGMNYLNTSEVTNMAWMFTNCTKLTSLDVSHFNTSKVTSMSAMFAGCSKLRTIYVGSGWTTAAVTSSDDMFYDCTSLVGGQGTTYNANHTDKAYAHIDGGTSNPGYFTAESDEPWPIPYACYTSENTTLTFYYDAQNTSRPGVTYALNTGYTEPGWYTDYTRDNVTKVVFDPSFAGARPTSTYGWFYKMVNLQSITGMSYLNTSKVTYMSFMFQDCYQLTSLDVSGFNTSKVTSMRGMFNSCRALTSLDLSNFNTSRVTDMTGMFRRCGNLRTITVGSDWSTAAVVYSQNMFGDDTCLVGGMGTIYDENHVGAEYAHIDGGPDNPGYFTETPTFILGDVNGDGNVTISDVTALIDLLLGGGAINNPAADCNGDTNVTISDVTALIDFLLGGTWN